MYVYTYVHTPHQYVPLHLTNMYHRLTCPSFLKETLSMRSYVLIPSLVFAHIHSHIALPPLDFRNFNLPSLPKSCIQPCSGVISMVADATQHSCTGFHCYIHSSGNVNTSLNNIILSKTTIILYPIVLKS
jgi:hypothetical protein